MDTSPSASDRQLYAGTTEKVPDTAEIGNYGAAKSSRWKKTIVIGAAVLICVVLAVVLPVYFLVVKKQPSQTSADTGTVGGSGGGVGQAPPQPNGLSTLTSQVLCRWLNREPSERH